MTETAGIPLPDPADMPDKKAGLLPWLAFFIRPQARIFGIFLAVRILRYGVLFLLPLAVGLTIRGFESGWAYSHPVPTVLAIGTYMAIYYALLFSIGLFTHESAAQDRVIRAMTIFAIRHINSLPLDWHEAQGSGGKLQRVMAARSGLKGLIDVYKWYLVPFIGALLAIMVSVAAIDAPAWFILLYLGFAASFIATALYTAKPLPGLHDRHNAVLEKLLSGVYEFVSAVRTVKAFGMAPYIDGKARLHEQEGHGAWQGVLKAIFRKWVALNGVGGFWICTFLGVCLAGVFGKWLSVGAFATLFFLAYDLWRALENLVYVQDQMIEYRAGFMRLTETLTTPPRLMDLEPSISLDPGWQVLRFEKAGFTYPGSAAPALEDINLEIRRGEKVALVGPSGAGKSTFIKMLMKQVWPGAGRLSLDGADLRAVRSADWLSHIGFVPQDVELFNMSIRDNILLDRANEDKDGEADDAAYRAALDQSAFGAFVDSLPDGDRTLIGERGIRLSGGQRQRLGIARALVRRAELIVFDEATSALDSLSEQAIRQAIETAFADKTLVLIAHRLSTVRHVDRIFVLDGGRLVEQGRFEDLTRGNGPFSKMWALQSEARPESGAKDAA